MGGAPDGGRPAAPRLTLEYDGGPFSGWARQPGKRTIQEELEGALGTIARLPVSLTVAGRTDAGVHAFAQVASYDGPAVEPRRVNALLPPALGVPVLVLALVPTCATQHRLRARYEFPEGHHV